MLPGKKYTVQDIVRLAVEGKWLLVVPVVVCAFAALVASSFVQDRFQSDMLIQVVPQRVPDAYVRSTVTVRTDEQRIDAISEQVKSRTQLEQLINTFGLYQLELAKKPLSDVVDRMRNDIDVEVVRGVNQPADAFHVRFTYRDPEVAAKVTQRLGSLFVEQNSSDRDSLAAATNRFLDTQLSEARQRLEQQERKLEQFREAHAGRLPSQLDFNMQSIQNSQMQLQSMVESIARDRDRKLMLERMFNDAQADPVAVAAPAQQAANPADAASVAGSPQQQLEAARAALTRLELRLKPEHPDILRTKRLIADLEKKAADAPPANASAPVVATVSPQDVQRRERLRQMAAEIESLDRQIKFREGEEQRLRGQVASYQQRIEAIPGIESEWTALTRDYDTQQQAYRSLLTKSEDSKVAVDLERRQIGEQFRILDPARVPVRPVGPVRLQINLAGLGLGIVVGLALVALRELRDASFKSEGDVLSVLSLPVLATLPLIEDPADLARRARRRLVASAVAVTAVAGAAYVFWALQLWKHIA